MLASSNISALTCLLRCSSRRFVRPSASALQLRYNSTLEKLQLPTADDAPKIYSEKITGIVSEISKLTILEVSDLNELLKKTLNISEAPVMAMGMAPAAGQKVDEEEEDAGAIIQTSFTLKITKFDDTKKVALIKHMKTIMEDMNLVQAKKFIEALPAIVRKDVPKDEVEKLKEELIAVGADCEIE